MKITLEFDSQEEYDQFIEKNKVVVHHVTKDSSLTEVQEAMARAWEDKNSVRINVKPPEPSARVPGTRWDWGQGWTLTPKSLDPAGMTNFLKTI